MDTEVCGTVTWAKHTHKLEISYAEDVTVNLLEKIFGFAHSTNIFKMYVLS